MTPAELLMGATVLFFALAAFGPAVRRLLEGDPLAKTSGPPKPES